MAFVDVEYGSGVQSNVTINGSITLTHSNIGTFMNKFIFEGYSKLDVTYNASNEYGGLRLYDYDTDALIYTFTSGSRSETIDLSGHSKVYLRGRGESTDDWSCTISQLKFY